MTAPARQMDHSAPAAAPTAFTFSVPRTALLEALGRVSGSTKASQLMPILGAVLITAETGALSFATTDMEHWVDTTLPLSAVKGAGRVALPVKRLTEIVASLPVGSVTIDIKDVKAKITAGRSKFEITGLPPADWPLMPTMAPTLTQTIDGRAFVAALSRVSPFAAVEGEARLQGALLESGADGLSLVCSNRNTIGLALLSPPSEQTARAVILPRDTFPLLGKLFGDDEALTLHIGEGQCQLVGARSSLSTRLIEGPFVPYHPVLVLSATMTIVVDRDHLMAAVERCALMADLSRVGLRFSEDGISLFGFSSADGVADDYVEATRTLHDDRAPQRVMVNGDFLRAALKAIPTSEVALELHGHGSKGEMLPVYVRAIPDKDAPLANASLTAIGPMRFTDPRESATSTEDQSDA